MIIVTGAAGFIGSQLIKKLNSENFNAIIAVDKFNDPVKIAHLEGLRIQEKIDRDEFFDWIRVKNRQVEFIFHIGARTDTAEFDRSLLWKLNTDYSKKIWTSCIDYQVPLIYASSAATYGDGSLGFEDNVNNLETLRPLNMYGYSKQLFDLWTKRNGAFDKIVGLKYFNVFGPNEYHKGDMRSVVHKAFEQARDSGKVKLFKSHNPGYKDGEQLRDFIYIKDAVDMSLFFLDKTNINGLFNIGSGKARSWNDLVAALFKALNKPVKIEYVDMPEHLRDKYQYFTEANMKKIKKADYTSPISSLEEGVTDYIKNYLLSKVYLGA